MPAHVICKFHKDLIKIKRLCLEYGLFQKSKTNNSKVTGLNRPEFKFDEDPEQK